MDATTVAVELAKNVFRLAVSDRTWRIVHTARLSRQQFARWFDNRQVGLVLMEACGSAHYWARVLQKRGSRSACYRPATCAPTSSATRPMATRTARINALRGLCREFGLAVTVDARTGLRQIASALDQLPASLRQALQGLLNEVRELEQRIAQIERLLTELARHSAPCQRLLSVPGVGLLTATAMTAATGGSVSHFQSSRHFAAWFGLTPREHSSGSSRHLGHISKRGDRYLRMLLTHGARSVFNAASLARKKDRPVDPLRAWALSIAQRSHLRCRIYVCKPIPQDHNIDPPSYLREESIYDVRRRRRH